MPRANRKSQAVSIMSSTCTSLVTVEDGLNKSVRQLAARRRQNGAETPELLRG